MLLLQLQILISDTFPLCITHVPVTLTVFHAFICETVMFEFNNDVPKSKSALQLQPARTAVHAAGLGALTPYGCVGVAWCWLKLQRRALHLVLLAHCVHLNGCCELLELGPHSLQHTLIFFFPLKRSLPTNKQQW